MLALHPAEATDFGGVGWPPRPSCPVRGWRSPKSLSSTHSARGVSRPHRPSHPAAIATITRLMITPGPSQPRRARGHRLDGLLPSGGRPSVPERFAGLRLSVAAMLKMSAYPSAHGRDRNPDVFTVLFTTSSAAPSAARPASNSRPSALHAVLSVTACPVRRRPPRPGLDHRRVRPLPSCPIWRAPSWSAA